MDQLLYDLLIHPVLIQLLALLVCALPLGYWFLQALASVRSASPLAISERQPSNRFVIAIPAHNEASVVEATVQRMRALAYPTQLCSIHIVADHCSDDTAVLARQAGAFVHERDAGPRTGKGAALLGGATIFPVSSSMRLPVSGSITRLWAMVILPYGMERESRSASETRTS